MRIEGLGRILFGLSFAVRGAIGIAFHNAQVAWQPLLKGIVGHDALSDISGAILLVGGIAILVPRTARIAALALGFYLLVEILVLVVPTLVAHPLIEGNWYSVSEPLTLVAGAWTIFSLLPGEGAMLANWGNVRAGQIVFALALPAIGLSHFFYMNLTAPLIPSYLPFHVPLGYLTGAAHIAAGVGILLGIGLAATLEAVMVSLFTLLVWVPMVIAAPASRGNWSEILVSTAISGAAWAVAGSFRRPLTIVPERP
ncbi:MAG TPA: hypothetical protein VJ476_15165 [Rhizomicrobium sp.]|nr:hypothetical protein [Rhizomicrobium sp.]